jgi:muconolactone delta-isomerase
MQEFLVEFDVHLPDGTSESEVDERSRAEAAAAADLARQGHLVRLWKPPVAPGQTKAVGLYRAGRRPELLRLVLSQAASPHCHSISFPHSRRRMYC